MRVLTGIQPSGIITLGNYLGSIKNFEEEIKGADESFIFIADLHAMTVTPNKEDLNKNIKNLVALYIAMGMNKKSTIFLQSNIKEHAELGWLLQCHTKLGELDRMTQFKEKSQKNISVGVGLYTYPTLMAADILLYDTDKVPVGVDQKQHLELTRDIAIRMNSFYKKDIFVVPEPIIKKEGAKIFSLVDPSKKMSKSDENVKSFISILDEEKVVLKKIKSATTDSVGKISYDPENQPGVSNLLTIYSLCKEISMDETLKHFKDQNYGFLKTEVAEAISETLTPIQEEYERIIKDESIILEVLEKAKNTVEPIAKRKMKEVKKELGFL